MVRTKDRARRRHGQADRRSPGAQVGTPAHACTLSSPGGRTNQKLPCEASQGVNERSRGLLSRFSPASVSLEQGH